MYRNSTYARILSVALLYAGSAISLISCDNKPAPASDNIMTMRGDTITMLETDKGQLVNRYYTPLMEKYENAPEPYEEYKYGVDIISYDSVGGVKSTFRANYAIRFINLNLWEAKGDVVVTNEKGDRLETQQLFWNRATGRVYSNVDSHFLLGDGIIRGEGFESKQDLSDWTVRGTIGTIMVDTEPTRDTIPRDSLYNGVPDTHRRPDGHLSPPEGTPADRRMPLPEEGGADRRMSPPSGRHIPPGIPNANRSAANRPPSAERMRVPADRQMPLPEGIPAGRHGESDTNKE